MGRLNDKVALITGGTDGMGLAMATLFKQEGAQVVVTGRDEKKVAQTEKALGPGALAVKSDAGKLADITQLINVIKNRFGRLDVLVINAGILRLKSFEAVDEASYDEVMGVNLKGAFFAIQGALPLLRPGASVILITSVANGMGFPEHSVYAATKAALASLARSISADCVGRGIRVNSIRAGGVATGILAKAGLSPEALKHVDGFAQKMIPLRRMAQPAEIARIALFLASDDSTFVIGEEIVADGGQTQLFSKPEGAAAFSPTRT